MKKIAIISILLFALLFPRRAQAQEVNWIALQSDIAGLEASGQVVNLSVQAMLDTAINGASFILRYDPACFKVSNYQPGSLLPGATAFVQEQPGQLDLTYYFQGKGQGLTGEGSLVTLQLETLQLCDSALSLDPETITLGVLDASGLAFNLPGVEYRSLDLRLAPVNGLPVVTAQPNSVSPALVPLTGPAVTSPGNRLVWIVPAAATVLLLGLVLVVVFFLRTRRQPVPAVRAAHTRRGPALMHAGRSIPLPRQRTQIGRHIEIVHQNGEFYVVDNGSRLGVFLNGNRLGSGYYPLRNGDRVQLGQEISYQFVDAH